MPESHTATDQWQSFELRMRRRRVERCVLRATAALKAGNLADATEAIDEARDLDPSDHGVQQLAARIHAGPRPAATLEKPPAEVVIHHVQPAAPEPAPPAASRVLLPIAALLILLCGVAGWFWTRTYVHPRPQPSVNLAPQPQPVAQNTEAPPPPLHLPQAAAETELASTETDVPPATLEQQVAATAGSTTPSGAVTAAEIERSPKVGDKEPEDLAEKAVGEPPPANAAVPVATFPVPKAETSRTDSSNAASGAVTPAPPLPDAPPAPVPALVPELETSDLGAPVGEAISLNSPASSRRTDSDAEPAIEAVLKRYEAAYSRLDAEAVAGVWPSVDRRALARAFEGLVSQRVNLGRCQIGVSGTSARAECAGTAAWVPQVGGGYQSAPRIWTFQLKQAASDWVILSAKVR